MRLLTNLLDSKTDCNFEAMSSLYLSVAMSITASLTSCSPMLLLLLPNPFRGMRAWWKTMEPQKSGNSPWPGPEIAKRQRVAKERTAPRGCSCTVQNEMRGVLGRVSAGAA